MKQEDLTAPGGSPREEAIRQVAGSILAPLTRSRSLEILRLVSDADGKGGGKGINKGEIQAGFSADERADTELLLPELIQARAVGSLPDPGDARRRRYHPNPRTPHMLAIGDGLSAWVDGGLPAPAPARSAQAAKLPLRLATTLWVEGIVPALHQRPFTVDDLAAALGERSTTRIRHIVDRAAEQGLLQKRPGPGGQNILSTSAFFSRFVPTAARATLYMSRTFNQAPDCLTGDDLRAAFGELLKAVTLDRPLDTSIALRALIPSGRTIAVVGTFRGGVLVRYASGGAYTAKIESDLGGWLVFLAGPDRSQLNWAGRGAGPLLEGIETLVRV